MHEACNHGFFDIAKMLIENGANVNVSGCDNVTPLHDAAMNSHLRIVRLLISSGAKVDAVNKQGMSPLNVAAGVDVVEYLEDKMLPKGAANQKKESKAAAAARAAAGSAPGSTHGGSSGSAGVGSMMASSAAAGGTVAAAASAASKERGAQQHTAAPKLRTVTSTAHVLSPPKLPKVAPVSAGVRHQQELAAKPASAAARAVAAFGAPKQIQKPKQPAPKAKPQQLSAKVAAAAKGNKTGKTALQMARESSNSRKLAAAAAARARAAYQQQHAATATATATAARSSSGDAASVNTASASDIRKTIGAHAAATVAVAIGSAASRGKGSTAGKSAKANAKPAAKQTNRTAASKASKAAKVAAATAAAEAAATAAAASTEHAAAMSPMEQAAAIAASMLGAGAGGGVLPSSAVSAQMVALMYQQAAALNAAAVNAAAAAAAASQPAGAATATGAAAAAAAVNASVPASAYTAAGTGASTFVAPGPLARLATKPASVASPPSAAPWRQSDILPPQRSNAYTPPQTEKQVVKSTKATRRNKIALAKKLDRVQDRVTSLPPGYNTFLTETRDFYEAKAIAEVAKANGKAEIPSMVPPGLVAFFRAQQKERDAAHIAMCREVDTVQLGYERGVIRAYHDAHHCINGRGDPSYYEKTHTLEFVMGAHGGLVVDLTQTVSLVYTKHKQAADDAFDRHRCEAEALEAMQKMAWSQKSRSTPVVPAVQVPKANLICK